MAARIILLTIHELDLGKVAGSKLQQAFQEGDVPDDLKAAVTEGMRCIRKAQGKAQREFASLRNSTIAHRDPDAVKQYNDIVSLDGFMVVKIAEEFYRGTDLFISAMPRLISHLGTLPSLLSQYSARACRDSAL